MGTKLGYAILMSHPEVKDAMPDCWYGFQLREARARKKFLLKMYPGWTPSICLIRLHQDDYGFWHRREILERNYR